VGDKHAWNRESEVKLRPARPRPEDYAARRQDCRAVLRGAAFAAVCRIEGRIDISRGLQHVAARKARAILVKSFTIIILGSIGRVGSVFSNGFGESQIIGSVFFLRPLEVKTDA
jgi:hypothetical protein